MSPSRYEGGTGAAPLTSSSMPGSPWEIGLAETHQTLVAQPAARAHRRQGSTAASAPAAT